MANLKFIRACKLLELQVTGDWPSSFEPEQVAKMQYPDSGSQSQMLCEALISACKDGTLNNTASVELRQRLRAQTPPGSSTTALLRDALRDNSYEASIYRITAIDLKSWFVEQDEQPAKHLTDWFASVIPACDSEVAVPKDVLTPLKPSSTKTPKTLIFEAKVLELMGKCWDDRTPGTTPKKNVLHKQVYNELLRSEIRGERGLTEGMVSGAAKRWKQPIALPVFVPDSKFNDKRHPFKGDK